MTLIYWKKFSDFLLVHKKISVLIASVLVFLLVGVFIYLFRIDEEKIQVSVSPYSGINQEEGRTVFSLSSQGKYLYKSKSKKGKEAAIEFIKANPSFNSTPPIFPEKFSDNAFVIREEKDADDTFLKSNNFILTNEHYFFDQKINGIPVYNAQVVIHLRNGSEIYATSGNVSTAKTQTAEKLSESEAIKIAIEKAREESGARELIVKQTNKFYVNEKLLGLSNDVTDKIALKVEVESPGVPVLFRTDYIISLTNGEIIYTESQTRDALSRNIYNCQGGSCILTRKEGDPTVTDADVNNLYTYFGNIYDFLANNFGRDSFDGSGALIKGYVHAPTGFSINGSTMKCPNAFWNGYEMVFCSGLVLLDVAAHELTHAITSRTANLQYMRQSGALNESTSDIFGSAVDGNWEIGENLTPGIGLPVPLRSMSNPPSKGNPDKLSSTLYHCAISDNGGVHKNSGVFNKTFYLMTDGGSYNGCSINGIGRDKSIKVAYQALTKYLTPTSNFKDAYASYIQACNDLFGTGSPECENVTRAMQATELDQQPTGSVVSPICQGIAMQSATCASSGGAPPVSPGPTGATPTGSTGLPTPTPVVGASGSWKISVTPICEGGKAHLKIDYDITDPSGGVFKTINDKGAPTGIEDMSYTAGTFGSPASGKGTYVSTGNLLSTTTGLTQDYKYSIEVHTAQADAVPSLIFSLNVTTARCDVSGPAPTIPSGPAPTGGTPGPSPTPRQMFTCLPDPKCINSGKSIQLCPLICQSVLSTNPTQSPTSPTATVPRGTSPTAGPTGSTNPTITTGALTPTTALSGVKATIDVVSEQKIREYLSNLVGKNTSGDNFQARYSCAPGNTEERNYIKDHMAFLGLSVEEQSFSNGNCTTKNIVARYDGKNKNSVYMVTAHMDSTAKSSGTNDPSPGADDNGSGTSAVMEIARAIATSKPVLEHSIEFVLFSGEEQGLYGSKYYANNFGTKTLMGLMNLDMIGISSGGKACVDFTYGVGGLGSAFTSRVVDTNTRYNIGLEARSILSVIPSSDHYPFQAKGKQAAFGYECVITTTLSSPIYHSLNDKIENINFDQITKTAKAVAGAVVDLADE
ncbi:MAG: M4 family metallopeptidase [Candidatus Levybacteria bacterium]|nr:M4 family metallopeptidase [Candidatus Levybacteria bacterium]